MVYMKTMCLFLCLLALSAFALAPAASAENEAWYFPDGLLYVPYVQMLDGAGDVVTNYAAFFRRTGTGWNFRLYGASGVAAQSNSVGTNYVTSTITNYTTISNYAFVTNYINVTNIYDDTNLVSATTNFVSATTNFVITTNVAITTNIVVVTNVPPPAPSDVAGTWNFTFFEAWSRTYAPTGFGQTVNMTPTSTNCTLTLTQDGADVEGTGTVNSIQYSLTGEVTNDFFVFTMLAGTADSKITLAEVRALVGDDVMVGDYSWSTTNGIKVQIGDFSAYKE